MLVCALILVSHRDSRLPYLLIHFYVAFQRVLEFINPTSLVALPKFNKFLVHCETALFSYPLDLVIRVSQGNAAIEDLVNSVERLAQKDGNVLFFKAGYAGDRTLGKQSSHISNSFRFSSPRSCLRSKEFPAPYTTYTRIDSPGRKPASLPGSRIVIPAFWFCSSPQVSRKVEH
jgi:hypothetical protein